jgi:hypothetical protein
MASLRMMNQQHWSFGMDYVFLTEKNEGLSEIVKSAIEPLGKSILLTRESSFSGQMEESLTDHDGTPVVVVIDIGAEKIAGWDEPLGHALKNRIIGGSHLPPKSSIIVLSEASKEEVFDKSSYNLNWRAALIDLKHQEVRKQCEVISNPSYVTDEYVAGMVSTVVSGIVEKIAGERVEASYKTRIFDKEVKGPEGLIEPPVKTEKTSRFSLSRLKDAVVSTFEK